MILKIGYLLQGTKQYIREIIKASILLFSDNSNYTSDNENIKSDNDSHII